jgi:hypothetical protein
MIIMMRTTINIPDDISDIIHSFADAKGITLGEALAELVRKALRPQFPAPSHAPFPCFAVSDSAAPITLEQTLAAEDEQ